MNKLLKSIVACVIGAALGGHLGQLTIGLVLALRQSPGLHSYIHPMGVFQGLVHIHPMGLFLGLILAGLPMLFVGIPAQAILQRFKLTDYFSNVGLATVCGALLAWYFAASLNDILDLTLLGTWVAFLTSSIAWLIRRPDRDDIDMPAEKAEA